MKRVHVILCTLCLTSIGFGQQSEVAVQDGVFVPAGTLVRCTLDEPNFSSATAQVGDPVLCHATNVEMFGRPLIPRGAYLSARLEEFKDPGHFFGKGWIQLEFTSLTVPAGNFPINAKVISAGRYRVDGEGKVKGKGHPTRDAVEWMIPILWPVKALTLPARGPRPVFKGETRVELRLMEDVVLPEPGKPASGGLPSRSSLFLPRPDASTVPPGSPDFGKVSPAASTPMQRTSPLPRVGFAVLPQTRPQPLTVLILRGGRIYFVVKYWVDNGNLEYTTGTGGPQSLPLDALDLPMTRQFNAERGIPFILSLSHH